MLKKTLNQAIGDGKITMQSFINDHMVSKPVKRSEKESVYAMTAIENFDDIGLDTPVKKSELVHLAQ